MIFRLPDNLTSLEALATVMISQALEKAGEAVLVLSDGPEREWFEMGGVQTTELTPQLYRARTQMLNYGEALRTISAADSFYPAVLAKVSGLDVSIEPPRLNVPISLDEAIVLAPFSLPELQLPIIAWRLVARFLRSYGKPVFTVGEPGQRIDLAGFTEAEIHSGLSVREQAAVLRGCSLVLGAPNAWSWTAMLSSVPTIIVYPDDVPVSRWLPPLNAGGKTRILAYPRETLELASLIVGLRFLIEQF
jgi:hypothetical protein